MTDNFNYYLSISDPSDSESSQSTYSLINNLILSLKPFKDNHQIRNEQTNDLDVGFHMTFLQDYETVLFNKHKDILSCYEDECPKIQIDSTNNYLIKDQTIKFGQSIYFDCEPGSVMAFGKD